LKKAQVFYTAAAHDSYVKMKEQDLVSSTDVKNIKYWVSLVENYGADFVQKIKDLDELENVIEVLKRLPCDYDNHFKDHALSGKRRGQRASSFNRDTGRIIYKVKNERIEIIEILKITNKHDYGEGFDV